VAQWEREIIGQRIAEALEAKRAGGWRHPNPRVPEEARRTIAELHQRGLSQRAVAERLNAEGVPAVGGRWHRETIRRVLAAEST
jgi:DNA invertase Pin-like site-specific DNA recombinase